MAKNILKTVIFLLVLALITVTVQKPFIPFNSQDTNQTATFYEIEKNSVDVLFVGTSSVMVGVSPLVIYENTGITSYVRGSSVQAPAVTYLNVKETLKYQKPKVIMCTIMAYFGAYSYDDCESWIRRGMDYKKLSVDKIEVAKGIADQSEWQTVSSYILPILRYHSRWDDLLDEGIPEEAGQYDYMHGQYPVYKEKPLEDVRKEKMAKTTVTTLDTSEYWYGKIGDLCRENGIKLVIMQPPNINWTTGKHNAIVDFAKRYDAKVLDFNVDGLIEKCGLNLETDFYDPLHVNARGSVKVSDYLCGYLKEECGLKASNVSDKTKKQFEKDIKRFKNDLNTIEYIHIEP